jgi:hypothetical protein
LGHERLIAGEEIRRQNLRDRHAGGLWVRPTTTPNLWSQPAASPRTNRIRRMSTASTSATMTLTKLCGSRPRRRGRRSPVNPDGRAPQLHLAAITAGRDDHAVESRHRLCSGTWSSFLAPAGRESPRAPEPAQPCGQPSRDDVTALPQLTQGIGSVIDGPLELPRRIARQPWFGGTHSLKRRSRSRGTSRLACREYATWLSAPTERPAELQRAVGRAAACCRPNTAHRARVCLVTSAMYARAVPSAAM